MTDQAGKTIESPKELYARVRPLMDAVDLDDLTDRAKGAIKTGELSGVEADEEIMRLMQLATTGVITSEEASKIIPLMRDV